MNEILPCCWLIYDVLCCEGTGVGASPECNQMTDPGPCQLEVERHLLQVLAPLGRTGNAPGCSGGSLGDAALVGTSLGVTLPLWEWGGASPLRPDTLPGITDCGVLKQCQQMVSELYLSRHRTCGR